MERNLNFTYLDDNGLKKLTAGEKLRRERQRRGWSQPLVARAMGLTHAQISRLENGHSAITPERAVAFEELFGIPREALLPDLFIDRRIADRNKGGE